MLELARYLCDQSEQTYGYDLVPGWCWGYACRPIRGTSTPSNHCLTGDTLVVTYDGQRPISELAEEGSAVLLTRDPQWNGQRARWVDAPVRSFGEDDVYELTLTRGGATKTVRATAAHRWFTQSRTSEYVGDYRSRYVVRTDEVVTSDLAVGDRLASAIPPAVSRITASPYGIGHGLTFGDGTLQPHTTGRSAPTGKTNLWGHDMELLRFFPPECPTSPIETENGITGIQVRALPNTWKRPPSLDESTSYLAGWLAGYIAADGHVRDSEVRLCSVDREALEFAAVVAARVGIACRAPVSQKAESPYGVHTTWSLAFVSATVPDWLLIRQDQSDAWSEPRSGRSPGWQVAEVRPTGEREEVFCATVDGTGAFVLADWILTGNSWGLALDLNAPKNPMASSDWHRRNANRNNSTFPFGLRIVTDMPEGMVLAWERAGFRWGGRYRNRPDAMHFEYMGTPAQMAATTAQLTGGPPGMATQLDRMEDKIDKLLRATYDGYAANGVHSLVDAVNQILYDIRGVSLYTDNTIRHFIQDQDKRTRELTSEEHRALTDFIADLAAEGDNGPVSISAADAKLIATVVAPAVIKALQEKPLIPS